MMGNDMLCKQNQKKVDVAMVPAKIEFLTFIALYIMYIACKKT